MSRNHENADRLDGVHERKATPYVREHAKGAQFPSESEVLETPFVTDDTKRKLLRSSLLSDAGIELCLSKSLRAFCFAYGFLVMLVLAVTASVVAMGTALSWPLSEANLEFALIYGAVFGAISGMVSAGVAAAKPTLVCLFLISVASFSWAAIIGFLFFVFVAGTAAC